MRRRELQGNRAELLTIIWICRQRTAELEGALRGRKDWAGVKKGSPTMRNTLRVGDTAAGSLLDASIIPVG